jgi:hypothetical protein
MVMYDSKINLIYKRSRNNIIFLKGRMKTFKNIYVVICMQFVGDNFGD